MNLISHQERSIYIHIPKNGGHSIVNILTGDITKQFKNRKNKGKWEQIPLLLRYNWILNNERFFKSYYVFTIVRNR